ncbi:MAG: hypothetical protein E6Q97_00920 [Desulfurellales bacterium]|nr:MAG: hypothetical protein E6Q97_00920 [Desulfurellales bacterium]
MSQRPWNNTDYPWEVGHRLKRSQRVLQHAEALKYFAKLAHCKTRFMWQKVPLGVVCAFIMSRRTRVLADALLAENPILKMLKKHGAIK